MNHSQTPKTLLARLGEFTYRRRGLVLMAWLLGLVIAFGALSAFWADLHQGYAVGAAAEVAAEGELR